MQTTNAVDRALLRYHGGKWRLAPWIIGHFPEHRVYVEPYGGAASVLLRKPRSYSEVYNDLDGEVINLFRVLRNPSQARDLVRQVYLTPYAREEFELSYILDGDPVEQARRTLLRFAAGHSTAGSQARRWHTGFRCNVTRSYTTPAHDWQNFPAGLEAIIERLRGVVIENLPALEVLAKYDKPETLFYVDPPYPHETRNQRWATENGCYRHEMSETDHRELASVLRGLRGKVVLSGYACELYDLELYPDWQRVTRKAWADSAGQRVEVLWLSPGVVPAYTPQLL